MEDTCTYDFLTIAEVLEIEPDLQIEQYGITDQAEVEEDIF